MFKKGTVTIHVTAYLFEYFHTIQASYEGCQ